MEKNYQEKRVYAAAALLGAIIFVLVYGVQVLNPVYDDWLLGKGDLTQHYLGWCFYRRDNWHFPIGLTNLLAYPHKTSVIFTDSIPLLAVFFKLLSPILPETFQYFGWWGIASFALQGFFAAKILRKCSVGKISSVLGSILFILSPVVIEKMFRHTALGGHWIVLAAIYLFVCHSAGYQEIRKSAVYWGAIGVLVAIIHMYYLPMCGAFLGGYILCSFLRERKVRLRCLLPGVTFVAGLFVSTYLLGGFSTRSHIEADGLGECSFNLNAFFNAKGYSRFFPSLPMYADAQYEGFAYLGCGIFALLAVAIVYLVIAGSRGQFVHTRDKAVYAVVYGLMALGLTVFAASPFVTFNNKLLFVLTDSSTLTHYWSIFRATGRIIWPVYYMIYVGVIVCNDRLWRKCMHKESLAVAVLGVCCAVQLFDIGDKLAGQRETFASKVTYESPLKNEVWSVLSQMDTLEHVIWVPNSFGNRELLTIAEFAYENELTMNIYYFARAFGVKDTTQQSMENPNDSCIYLFRPKDVEELGDYGLHLYEADGYVIGTTFLLEN